MSCWRHSSALLRSPRQPAITSSSFCCAVNLRYLRVSPNVALLVAERPIL
jgi:hypothetical protein